MKPASAPLSTPVSITVTVPSDRVEQIMEAVELAQTDDIQAYGINSWLTLVQAASILNINHDRAKELAIKNNIPLYPMRGFSALLFIKHSDLDKLAEAKFIDGRNRIDSFHARMKEIGLE